MMTLPFSPETQTHPKHPNAEAREVLRTATDGNHLMRSKTLDARKAASLRLIREAQALFRSYSYEIEEEGDGDNPRFKFGRTQHRMLALRVNYAGVVVPVKGEPWEDQVSEEALAFTMELTYDAAEDLFYGSMDTATGRHREALAALVKAILQAMPQA